MGRCGGKGQGEGEGGPAHEERLISIIYALVSPSRGGPHCFSSEPLLIKDLLLREKP